jgi:hypothetical protein
MKPELLKTEYIEGLTRKQLEQRIRIVETERDALKTALAKWYKGFKFGIPDHFMLFSEAKKILGDDQR